MTEKERFMKQVVILCDTREKRNKHILDLLDTYNIQHESRKLDYGDYSFKIDDRDFSLSCIVERKANINELWGNVTKDRERFEKELSTAHSLSNSFSMIIEGVQDWNTLKKYTVSDIEMFLRGRKVQNIGEYVHNTLKSWSSANRYNFEVIFVPDARFTALQIVSIFYWYYHNYKSMVSPLNSERTPRKPRKTKL